ncbi:TRAP-type C4-dicarboxylate transport system, large permease component [Olavius algarvensis Delta 1 endosymbiont]|nr:TRAP-type C4-dicarboxylate transport system, large permease component [Olavius algarvensis Delta 1 endosymbiont]
MPLTFFWIFLVTMVLGIPIAFGLAAAPVIGFILADKPVFIKLLPQRLFIGINQFPLLAIPMFLLAGEIMNKGGITKRIVRFASVLVGHFRGGLAQVNILASILFAGLSGSAVADTSALGSILIPAMKKDGYTAKFSAAVTAASSVIGPIIPPSIIMVVYGLVMSTSVAGLFLAGFVPGLLMGGGMMIVTAVVAKKKGFPKREYRASIKELWEAFRGAFLPLLTPVIILGGILSGVFTPTEAAGAAVAYALILSIVVLRTLRLRDLPDVLYRTGVSSAAILFVVGTATVFSGIIAISGLPGKLGAFVFSITDNVYLLLFLVNILMLIVGMFLDASPAILILGPILAPTMMSLGIHPLHFAIIMCVNLTVGLATPPLGLILFVASSLTKLQVLDIAKEMAIYLIIHLIIIFMITYMPFLTMTLPKIAGYY